MKDADSLELILTLKEEQDIGNTRAPKWIPLAVKRLKTPWVHREGQAGADKRF